MLRKEVFIGIEIDSKGFFVAVVQKWKKSVLSLKHFAIPVEDGFFCSRGLPTDSRFLGQLLFSSFQKEQIPLSHSHVQVSLSSGLWEYLSFVTILCGGHDLEREVILEFQEKLGLDVCCYSFQYETISCCDSAKVLVSAHALKKEFAKSIENLFFCFNLKILPEIVPHHRMLSTHGQNTVH